MYLPLTLTSVVDLDSVFKLKVMGFVPMHVYSARSSNSTFSMTSLAFSTPLSSLCKVMRESLISLPILNKYVI